MANSGRIHSASTHLRDGGSGISAGEGEIIAGLDLGTTKVCAIVGEVTDDGIDIIGVGSVPSKGLRRGVVVNIETTVQAIRAAIEQAESMAGVEIGSVYAGISGSHVQGLNKEGVAAIANREVTAEDVASLLEFLRLLFDQLYVVPAKVIAMRERRGSTGSP